MRGKVTALVGAQYGSEGKGAVAQYLANEYYVWIRTGGPNAGHTIYHEGQEYKMQSIPCGWINPKATLIIGPGAVVDLQHLVHELRDCERRSGIDIASRLYVDRFAAVIDPLRHRGYEGGIRGDAHAQIGSTGEGVGITRMARINRGSLVRDLAWGRLDHVHDFAKELEIDGIKMADTAQLANNLISMGSPCMLEGTQGSGLSLIHGPWPYVTSADTNAAQLAADAGIPPHWVTETILVARTFPIRVAGNSGPLLLETSWEEIGQPEEKTTVTKKVRRVGKWDTSLVKKAIRLNDPAYIAMMFIDYLFPGYEERTEMTPMCDANVWIADKEKELGVPIKLIGTGPQTIIDLREEVA